MSNRLVKESIGFIRQIILDDSQEILVEEVVVNFMMDCVSHLLTHMDFQVYIHIPVKKQKKHRIIENQEEVYIILLDEEDMQIHQHKIYGEDQAECVKFKHHSHFVQKLNMYV